jgi:ADP-ribose pyrophosphatase YjhB (NUDIX family)
MNFTDAITFLEKEVPNPSAGLPDELFYYISKTTPLVNVDLLIKDANGRILLAWREDPIAGIGWHIPGGIIRFKETFEQRVQKVAQLEIGVDSIQHDPTPLALNQLILNDHEIRGHFISILYNCSLPETFVPENKGISNTDPGYLMWHDTCPHNLLKVQNIYKDFL